MKFILKLLITALSVVICAWLLPGVSFPALEQNDWQFSALLGPLLFALVLALLNTFIKPVLKVLTFPITLVTFGLFLLVINALMIGIADWLLDSIEVASFWWAILFSILLWAVNGLLDKVLGLNEDDRREE
ncbi:MAG: phage holin family protein [Flavobacteriales bacterium]